MCLFDIKSTDFRFLFVFLSYVLRLQLGQRGRRSMQQVPFQRPFSSYPQRFLLSQRGKLRNLCINTLKRMIVRLLSRYFSSSQNWSLLEYKNSWFVTSSASASATVLCFGMGLHTPVLQIQNSRGVGKQKRGINSYARVFRSSKLKVHYLSRHAYTLVRHIPINLNRLLFKCTSHSQFE